MKKKQEFVWAKIISVKKEKSGMFLITFKQEIFVSSMFISKETKDVLKLRRGQEVLLYIVDNWSSGFITESGLSYFITSMIPVKKEKETTK